MENTILKVKNLRVHFQTLEGRITAVAGSDFEVRRGEVFCLVGESGCGKSLTSLAVMGLVKKPGFTEAETLELDGTDLLKIREKDWRKLRGNKMSMIFQEPLTSLNPLYTIGNQMDEVFMLHQGMNRSEAARKSVEMLSFVGIPDAESVYRRYPVSLSGGMRQRVMIAMALSCRPQLLIADEPTTALDVTIQKQILNLIKRLRRELNTAVILITHDLSVVAEMGDRVAVMYAGEIVEQAEIGDLFRKPLHPYTEGLINSTIKLNDTREELPTITGTVPPLTAMPDGCRFHPRCPYADERCRSTPPGMAELENGRLVRCLRYRNSAEGDADGNE